MKNFPQKIVCVFLSLLMMVSFTCNSFASTQSSNIESNSSKNVVGFKFDDLEFTPTELNDGVTVIFKKNSDDTFSRTVVTDSENIMAQNNTEASLASVNDGQLEFATFHLGFNHWNNDKGRLYFEVNSDEPLSRVSGHAYVKGLSILNGQTFYDSTFSKKARSQYHITKTLKEHVNTGKEKKVRVGYSDVYLTIITGDSYSLGNASQIVAR